MLLADAAGRILGPSIRPASREPQPAVADEAEYEVAKQKSVPLSGEILVGKGHRILFGGLVHYSITLKDDF